MTDTYRPGGQPDPGAQFQEPSTSLTDILAAVQNLVVATQEQTVALQTIFPQATAYSTTAAIAGAITFTSSQATGFLSVVTSSGATVKVAVYG